MNGCPECGFTSMDIDPQEAAEGHPFPWRYDESDWGAAGAQIVTACDAAAAMLRSNGDVRTRPVPGRWSSLEYACHIRDVLLIQRERVLKALRGHGNEPLPMGRDERVEDDGYNEQDRHNVAVQLEQSAILFVGLLDRLTESEWAFNVAYAFPESSMRSLRWVAVHTAHEVARHLHDMRSPT